MAKNLPSTHISKNQVYDKMEQLRRIIQINGQGFKEQLTDMQFVESLLEHLRKNKELFPQEYTQCDRLYAKYSPGNAMV